MIFALLLSVLTIDEAVERALRNNPEVTVARASLAVVSAEANVARTLPAPEFRMSIGSFDADPETVRDRTTVGMRYSPPRPRELALQQAIVQARAESARAAIRVAEARAAAQVRLAFRRAVMAQTRALVAEKQVVLQKNRRRTLLRQVAVGLKESDEKALADLDVDEAENALRRTASLAELERRKLARLIDPAGAVDGDLATDPEMLAVPAATTAAGELLQLAMSRRAELAVVDGACKVYEAERRLARNQRYPWISFVEVSHRVTYLPERGPWGWKFGVDLPLFRSEAAAQAKVAEAQQARCQAESEALAAKIRKEVEDSLANLEQVRRELEDVDRLRSGPAQRALDRAQVALTAGRAEQLDVFAAEARLLAIQDRWLDRRLAYIDLEAQLETAVGAPLASRSRRLEANSVINLEKSLTHP
jgi:outer membrane protein TolC